MHYVPVPLPGPRLPHDMAITPNWSILNDMPLVLGRRNCCAAISTPRGCTKACRPVFALIPPPRASPEDTRWVRAVTDLCCCTGPMHYEEGDDGHPPKGYHQPKPMPDIRLEEMGRYSHRCLCRRKHSFQEPPAIRWRCSNLTTGRMPRGKNPAVRTCIGRIRMNQPRALPCGKSRYVWSTTTPARLVSCSTELCPPTIPNRGGTGSIRLPEGSSQLESPMVTSASPSSSEAIMGARTRGRLGLNLHTFLIDGKERRGASQCAILRTPANISAKGPILPPSR